MLNIYTSKKLIPDKKNYVKYNDAFFGEFTQTEELTSDDLSAIRTIDKTELVKDRFGKVAGFDTPFGFIRKDNFPLGAKHC
jgi:hypothetical protein